MKDYDKNKESSYLKYWDVNNLYGRGMPQKLSVNNFEWIEGTFQFFSKLIFNILKNNMDFIMMYRFYLKQQKIEKVKKLITNLHNKTEYVIHIKNLKQALNHGVVLKKVHRVIKFDRNAWLKPYIDLNSKLKKAKNIFAGDFLKLMRNAVFGKSLENVRKH